MIDEKKMIHIAIAIAIQIKDAFTVIGFRLVNPAAESPDEQHHDINQRNREYQHDQHPFAHRDDGRLFCGLLLHRNVLHRISMIVQYFHSMKF